MTSSAHTRQYAQYTLVDHISLRSQTDIKPHTDVSAYVKLTYVTAKSMWGLPHNQQLGPCQYHSASGSGGDSLSPALSDSSGTLARLTVASPQRLFGHSGTTHCCQPTATLQCGYISLL
jgi:hypothetical protein